MAALLPVFVLLLFVITSPSCQSELDDDDQLTQAKPLSPGDTLVSRNGVFALGFFSPTNSNQSLYIGIWYQYNGTRDTMVWVANRDNHVTASAKLAITDNQELALSDGDTAVWSTPQSSTATNAATGATAVLLSSGNFVLRSANGTTIWQSFDHPSATILPTMKVLLSYKGSVATRLVAWEGIEPSPGDFSGSIDPNSNLQFFVWKSGRPYYRISFFDDVSMFAFGGATSATSTVVHPSVTSTGDEVYYTYTVVSDGSLLARVLLVYDGSMSLLTRNSNTPKWTASFQRPRPGCECDLYASCGPFGYCDHTETVPSCQCLDGFQPIDGLNISRGCRRNEALECGAAAEDRFVTLPGMMVPDNFLQVGVGGNTTLEQCAAECSANCSCTAYAYVNVSSAGALVDTLRCLLWTGDLVDTGKAAASSGQNL